MFYHTQKKPNTQKFWAYNCVNYVKYYPHNCTQTFWVQLYGIPFIPSFKTQNFWVSKPENVGFWVWVEFWVSTPNTLPKPKNFWVQLYALEAQNKY
jgi:hypothetical protein